MCCWCWYQGRSLITEGTFCSVATPEPFGLVGTGCHPGDFGGGGFVWLFVWMKCFQGDLTSVSLPPVNQRTGNEPRSPCSYSPRLSVPSKFCFEPLVSPRTKSRPSNKSEQRRIDGHVTRDAAVWKCETFCQMSRHHVASPFFHTPLVLTFSPQLHCVGAQPGNPGPGVELTFHRAGVIILLQNNGHCQK